MNPQRDVRDFHKRLGVTIADRPSFPSDEVIDLRIDLIEEELTELYEAIFIDNSLVGVADALADILYVTYGAALAFGIDIGPVWDEVHRSNMAKTGGPVRGDGKIMKPEGWTPPNIRRALYGHD